MSCLICFSPIEGALVKCTDPRCIGAICSECMSRFIDISHSDGGQKLSCARDGCEGEYDQVSVSSLTLASQKKYRECLLAYFSKVKKNEIDDRERHKQIITSMRQQRMEFYTQNMPVAVMKVAKIAFRDRLRKVQNAEAKRKLEQFNRVCINLFCGGFLDDNLKCCKCSVTFCRSCEQEKKDDDHMCREDMKESVAYVKSLRACPQCGTRIEKGEGCMAMTCAVCGTDFWYSTGEKGEAGNHGQSIPVVLEAFRYLNIEYQSAIPPFLNAKLKKLEEAFAEPLSSSDDTLIATATRARLTERTTEFSNLYSKTVRDKMEKMMMGKKLSQIEKLLAEKPEGYLNVLTIALMPMDERKVVMFKGTKGDDGVVFAEEIGVAENVKDVADKLGVELHQVIHALQVNNGALGEYFLQYE